MIDYYFNKKEIKYFKYLKLIINMKNMKMKIVFFVKNVIAVKKTFLHSLSEIIIFHFRKKSNL